MMKVLSVQQPYAWMLIHNFASKNIENRNWTTHYRGSLLIHAGKNFDPYALDWIYERLDENERRTLPMSRQDYQCGGIVGIAKFTNVLMSSDSRWFQGPYGWYFERAWPLEFYPLKGQLGLFDVHPSVLATIRREWQERKVTA